MNEKNGMVVNMATFFAGGSSPEVKFVGQLQTFRQEASDNIP
jgi:hypothetical protein